MEKDHRPMKFICKFCDKRYPCGKSLGGHLRSHRVPIPINLKDDCYNTAAPNSKRELKDFEIVGESSTYGLRTNPKKTRRFSDSSQHVALQQGNFSNVCKECGKGFQSMKALCGHMACHSEKDKTSDCNWSDEVFDSDTSDSETEEDEQEELAKCLMMLSRDTWPVPDSESKTHPVVLESKSSSIRIKFRPMETKQKSAESSGVSSNEHGNGKFESKNKQLNKQECPVCSRLFDTKKSLAGHISASSCRKKINREEQIWKNENPQVSKNNSFQLKRAKKSYKHECPICFRVFRSGQALGGHKRSHFLGSNSEDRSIVIAEQDMNEVPTALIDLNLPAPGEDEANEECGIVLC